MPITLDLGAILAVGAILAATAAILLLTTWRTAGRPAYLAAWGGFCGCTAVAFALYALRGRLPDGLLILLASPLYALAWALFWAGARWLRGARVRPWAEDVSSGVEPLGGPKGIKCADLIHQFCKAVRRADAALTR